MKITLVGPVFPYRGGIAHFTTLLAKKLREQGNDTQVISFKKQYPKCLYPGESDTDVGEGRLTTEADYILSPLNPITWFKTVKTIKQFDPNIVLLQWWVTFWGPALGFLARKLRKKGYIIKFLIHNCLPHEPLAYDKLISKQVLKNGHQFIVMNEREIGRLKNLLPTALNIVNVPMPIFNAFPVLDISKSEARKLFSLPQNKKLLLFFGLVRPYKGLQVLLLAFEELVNKGYDISLIIAGEFWENKNGYLKFVEQKGISDRVFFIDRYISDKETSEIFIAADVFVAPYLKGTQSAAIKTAAGFGIPIVMSNVVVDKLIFELHDYIIITESDNPQDLVRGIINSLDCPKVPTILINQMTEKSWDDMISCIYRKN